MGYFAFSSSVSSNSCAEGLLARAGVCMNTDCLLGGNGEDSYQQLFFKCVYSDKVCNLIMSWLGVRVNAQENLYTAWKKWGRKFHNKKCRKVCYTTIAAMVYHLWKVKN